MSNEQTSAFTAGIRQSARKLTFAAIRAKDPLDGSSGFSNEDGLPSLASVTSD